MNGAPTRPGRRRPSGDFCLNNPLHTIAARHLAHTDIIPPRAPRGRRSLKGEDMRVFKLFIVAAFTAALLFSLARPSKVSGQSPTEAPAAFDNMTNGFEPQGTPVPTPDQNPTPGTFESDKFIFSKVDEIGDGLGPVYNAQSCRECHENPVTGAIAQINELRAGHNLYCNSSNVCGPDPCPTSQVCTTKFVDAPGGSLINDRSIPTKNTRTPPFFGAKAQERVPPLYTAGILGNGGPITGPEKVRTFRTSLNTLGDGFVEAIADQTLLNIAADQVNRTGGQVHGQAIRVPVLESSGCDPTHPATCAKRVGRFGWKDQHASLLSL